MSIYQPIIFYRFFTNFLALLLCKINVLDNFDRDDLFQIFVISRSTETADRVKRLVRNVRAIPN